MLTGNYWVGDERGRAIVAWLRARATEVPKDRKLYVCLGDEFPTLAAPLFGAGACRRTLPRAFGRQR
jgi:hypothetical protein